MTITTLTSVSVTAKNARKTFVLEMFKTPRVEAKLVEQNLPVKAIYELPFKVTMEDKLRYLNIRLYTTFYPLTTNFAK